MITKEEWKDLPYQTTVWTVSDIFGIEETRKYAKTVTCDLGDCCTNIVDAEYGLLKLNLRELNDDS